VILGHDRELLFALAAAVLAAVFLKIGVVRPKYDASDLDKRVMLLSLGGKFVQVALVRGWQICEP
jgi:hypothetical protein